MLVVNAVWLTSGVFSLCLRSILKCFMIKVSFLVLKYHIEFFSFIISCYFIWQTIYDLIFPNTF